MIFDLGIWLDTNDFSRRWTFDHLAAAYGWMHVIADLAIWAAYMAIPVVLAFFILRRRDVPFTRVFWLFCVVILSCGIVHLMDAVAFWWPAHRLAAVVKIITALAAWATVLALIPVVPQALRLRGLARINHDLEHEVDERKRTESSLREREARLEAIVRHASDAVITFDARGRIETFNRAAERVLGYAAPAVIGRHADDILNIKNPDGTLTGAWNAMAACPQDRTLKPWSAVGICADGRHAPLELSVGAYEIDHARHFVGIARDIRERLRAEERFRIAVEASPSAKVMTDREGRIVLVNAQAERMFGYRRDELLGQPVDILVPHRIRPRHPEIRSKFFADPKPAFLGAGRQLYALHRSGREIPVEIGLSPIETDDGLLVLADLVDISQRQRAEKRFQLAVEASPIGNIMADREGRIVQVNAQTERIFGYRREELLGQSVDVLVPPRFRQRHPEFRTAFFDNPQARPMGAGRDLYGLRKDGVEVPVEISLNPIETDEGLLVLVAVIDITERKRAEMSLQSANEELRRRNEEMEQFVYTVSHDLKSPLVNIEGFAAFMSKDLTCGRTDRLADFAERISLASAKMRETIHTLLEISRIGRVVNEPEPVDVGELVHAWARDEADVLARAGAKLHVHPDLPVLMTDRTRCREVFENVLVNAVKYGCPRPGGAIEVGVRYADDQVRIFVRDQGPGIPPRYHKRVFELFQRLHHDSEGTGVGLSVVKRVLESQGGRVWVESEEGRGACFWLAWPASMHVPQSATAADPKNRSSPLTTAGTTS